MLWQDYPKSGGCLGFVVSTVFRLSQPHQQARLKTSPLSFGTQAEILHQPGMTIACRQTTSTNPPHQNTTTSFRSCFMRTPSAGKELEKARSALILLYVRLPLSPLAAFFILLTTCGNCRM